MGVSILHSCILSMNVIDYCKLLCISQRSMRTASSVLDSGPSWHLSPVIWTYFHLYQGQTSFAMRSLVRELDEYSLMMSLAMEQNHDLLTVDILPLASMTVDILRMLVWIAQVSTTATVIKETTSLFNILQWNLSNMDTLGTKIVVLIGEVYLGGKYTCKVRTGSDVPISSA